MSAGPVPDAAVRHSRAARRGMAVLVAAVATLLAVVVAAPIALSSQDLVRWAGSASGLGLTGHWPLLVFIALDAAAAACVGMVVYAAWRGEPGGAFALLVWLFAAGSAVANRRHGLTTAARDDEWFFPAMSLAGPALLEVTVRRVRRWVQTSAGRYERPLPHFRLLRWLPGIAARETLRAWRLAVTEGYSRPEAAVAAARAYGTGWRPGADDQPAPRRRPARQDRPGGAGEETAEQRRRRLGRERVQRWRDRQREQQAAAAAGAPANPPATTPLGHRPGSNGDALLAAGVQVMTDLERDGRALTRATLAEALRQRDVRISTDRAGGLLRTLRQLPPAAQVATAQPPRPRDG